MPCSLDSSEYCGALAGSFNPGAPKLAAMALRTWSSNGENYDVSSASPTRSLPAPMLLGISLDQLASGLSRPISSTREHTNCRRHVQVCNQIRFGRPTTWPKSRSPRTDRPRSGARLPAPLLLKR